MTKYNGWEEPNMGTENPNILQSSSLKTEGVPTFGITTTPPIPETNTHFNNDARSIAFEPPASTVSEDVRQARKLWKDKEITVNPKKSLIKRLAGNLYLRIALGIAAGGLGYAAADQAYQNVPAVHQGTDNALEKVGLKVVVPPIFDNKAEENVLGRNNSFYVTPEEYKEKGPPTVEGNHVNIPFFIRFNDGKEHIIFVKRSDSSNFAWNISGDLQGGELLVPAKEDGEISGGGGSGGFGYIYKPGMIFQNFSSWRIGLADGKGGKISFIITTGALQASKDLDLQQDGRTTSVSGHVRGFAPIGILLDNNPVFIASNTITPENKFNGAYTDIATIPTGQAYGIK